MKNVLITGGAGFIGSHLALKLKALGYNVRVLDNLSPQIHGIAPELTSPLYLSIKDSVEFIRGNVTSKSDWVTAIKDQNIIVHLAAETGTGQSMYEISKYSQVNMGGTAQMLDVLTNQPHKIEKLIVASSRAIYGEGQYYCQAHGNVYPEAREEEDMAKGDFECRCPNCNGIITVLPTSENSKIHPTSVYGITKQNQEQMVLTVCKSIGISAVAFRYQNVYGPGQSLSNPYTGILSIFSTQIKNGKNLNIFEDGNESRDFVYIDDVIDATILGIEKQEANNQVFNVGLGSPTSVFEVAKYLKCEYNLPIDIQITGKFRIGDIRHNYADLTKIKSKLGFIPKVSFEKGIHLFTEWVKKQPINIDKYEESLSLLAKKGLYK